MTTLPKFSQLSEIKQKAVKLRAEGNTIESISVELNTPFRTVQDWVLPSGQHWEELEEYKAHLAAIKTRSLEDFQKVIQADAEGLWRRLILLGEGKDALGREDATIPAHVVAGAIDSALDRIGLARVSKSEVKGSLAVTDEARLRRFKELAELQGDLQPEQLLRLAGNSGK